MRVFLFLADEFLAIFAGEFLEFLQNAQRRYN